MANSIQIKNLDKWINPVYHKYVQDYGHRFNVYYGGAGSGKSHFVCQKIILKALSMPRKVLVIRKVGATIKESIWSMFASLLNQMPEVVKSVNKSDFTITLINGSQFIFKGLDDSEKIKSIAGITDVVIEEATELIKDDFDQLNLRLRSKKSYNQIHLMFNPVSKANWVYTHFFANGTPRDCVIVHTTYMDNPHLPDEYIKSLHDLKSTNPAYYKIYVLGDFATLDKLVFPIVERRIISTEEVAGLPFWCGLDFGYVNDPTAMNWGRYRELDKTLFIMGEYNRRGMTNDQIAQTIISLGLHKEIIIADSAEQKSIDDIRMNGVPRIRPAVKGKDSVINGIDKLNRCHIVVDERCIHTLEEFDNYTWLKDKKTGEYINQPIDSFNHHVDCIRYGTQSVIGKITNWKF